MKKIQLGIFGLGVVSSHVIELLRENQALIQGKLGAEVVVKRVVTANPTKQRTISLEGIEVSSTPTDILDDPDIDMVLELIGGTQIASQVVKGALKRKRPVVTANKALLAEQWQAIMEAVANSGVPIGFEAAVGGGIPVLRALREGLAANQIEGMAGIINGTANYILTAMSQQGSAFSDALVDAQRLGYAETDPTFDVEGQDTAHKLGILVNLAYGGTYGGIVSAKQIYCEGITEITPIDIQYAAQLGYVIKLLAIARVQGDKIEARVHPALVPKEHLLASVNGAYNAVYLMGGHSGPYLCQGQGAGGKPTASAVVSDVMEVACWILNGSTPNALQLGLQHGLKQPSDNPLPVMHIGETSGEYYLRFQVLDRAGVLADIARIMGRRHISIKSLIQPSQAVSQQEPVQIILTTHRAQEKDVQQSMQEICAMPFISGKPQLLRMAGV